MLAAYLLDAIAIEPGPRAAGARAARLQGARRRRACAARASRRVPFARRCRRTALLDYAGERADLALQLADALRARARRATGSTRVYRELELPLVPILAGLERTGVRVDARALGAQAARVEQRAGRRCSAEIYRLAGETFNINSPKQLGDVLFEKLKLPVLKRTGTTRTPSTAVEVLEELALDPRSAAPDPRLARPVEAEGHLHRRPADAGQPGDRARAHRVQPGRRRHRAAEQQRSEPAEHPDPHRASAARSAAPSSPSPATC